MYEQKYKDFQRRMAALEYTLRPGTFVYITDDNVDRENVSPLKEKDGERFWRKMYFAAQDAAWMRLENQGFDPSKFGIEG